MAYANRKMAATPVAYPELRPVTERQIKRQPVKSRNKKQATQAERIMYMAVNAALIFGLVQCVRTLVGDGINLSQLAGSQASVQRFYNDSRLENQSLSDKIRIYSSPSGIEELARNYLNMVGENELPVRYQ